MATEWALDAVDLDWGYALQEEVERVGDAVNVPLFECSFWHALLDDV
jgi:hypothetical protein